MAVVPQAGQGPGPPVCNPWCQVGDGSGTVTVTVTAAVTVTVTAAMGAGTEPAEAQCDSLEGKVYLDNNATTPLAPEVAQAVWDAMCQAWGNPSSSHPTGRDQDGLGSVVMGARGSCQVWFCRQEGEGAHRQRTGEPGQDAGRPP